MPERDGNAEVPDMEQYKDFLRDHPWWYLIPFGLVLALVAALFVLGGSSSSPFAYQMF
jgi:hypothetical protein